MNIIVEKLPINDTDLVHLIMEIEKEHNITLSMDNLEDRLKQMVSKGLLSKQETIFGYRYNIKEEKKI